MLVPGLDKLKRAARHFRSRVAPRAVILLYHRIAQAQTDPWSLCVSPQHFAEHLEVLRDGYLPIALRRLAGAVEARQPLPGSAVITFDDGYADNFHQAKPLLERFDMPATVFVISGSVGSQREFWWDELERIILVPQALPGSLSLSIGGVRFDWRSPRSPWVNTEHCGNCANHERRDSAAESLYRALWTRLSCLGAEERSEVLDQLLVWSGAESVSRPSHRPVSVEELLALGEGKLIEIGSHTVKHPFLSKLSPASQKDEIRQSRSALEELIGRPVTSFAYPHGNYAAETQALIAQAGYERACTTTARTVRDNSSRFQLPRIMVEDWDGEEFARRLSGWLGN
jgi:peptidoglycan/xylan/chitin deacetylase (PgdA/CDA1 family)